MRDQLEYDVNTFLEAIGESNDLLVSAMSYMEIGAARRVLQALLEEHGIELVEVVEINWEEVA